jgi:hypothetical protein
MLNVSLYAKYRLFEGNFHLIVQIFTYFFPSSPLCHLEIDRNISGSADWSLTAHISQNNFVTIQ